MEGLKKFFERDHVLSNSLKALLNSAGLLRMLRPMKKCVAGMSLALRKS